MQQKNSSLVDVFETKIEGKEVGLIKAIESTIIFLIILTSIAFYPKSMSAFISTKLMVSEVLVVISLIFWGFKIIATEKIKLVSTTTNLPVLIFMITGTLSLLWTDNIYSSLRELPLFLMGPLFYFIIVNNIFDNEQIKRIIIFLLITGTLFGLYGIFQYFGIDFPIFEDTRGRQQVFGLFGNVNYFAEYLIAILPVAVSLLLANDTRIGKLLLAIALLSMFSSLIFTFTRSSYLGFGISLIFMVALHIIHSRESFTKNIKKILIVILLIITIVNIIFFLPNPLNEPGTVIYKIKSRVSVAQITEGSSIKRRIATWKFTVQMIKDHLLLGSGIGTYKYNTLKYQAEFFSIGDNRSLYPHGFAHEAHNEYLQIWAEIGIVGLGIFIWVIFFYFKYGLKILRSIKDKYKQGLLIGLMGAVIAVLVDSIFGFPLHLPATVIMFWLAFGLTISQGIADGYFKESPHIFSDNIKIKNNQRRKGNKTKKEIIIEKETIKENRLYKTIFLKISFALIIFFLTTFLIINAIRPFVARTYWFYADKEKNRNDIGLTEVVNNYKKALKWDPYLGEVYYDIAFLLMQNGFYTPALEYFKEAEKYVDLPGLPLNLARIYVNKGLLDEAAIKMQQAITYQDNEKSMLSIYVELGNIYLTLGENKKAEMALKEALGINDSYADAHYGLGRAFLNQKMFDEAVEEFQIVIDLAPDSLEAKYAKQVFEQLSISESDETE